MEIRKITEIKVKLISEMKTITSYLREKRYDQKHSKRSREDKKRNKKMKFKQRRK